MILDKIKEMGENLSLLQGHDRFHYLIDKAKEVKPMPDAVKTENNRIHKSVGNPGARAPLKVVLGCS